MQGLLSSPTQDLDPFTFRVVLVGDSEAGKTSIIQTYIQKSFEPDQRNTVGAAFHTVTPVVDNQKICVQIWDTAGQEKYRSVGPIYYRNASAALAIFDVTIEEFAESLENWIVNVKRIATDPLIFVVGNKSDLLTNDSEVMIRLEKFARIHNAEYLLTSAKTGANIDVLFNRLSVALVKSSQKNMDTIVHEMTDLEVKRSCCCIASAIGHDLASGASNAEPGVSGSADIKT
jgi:small GTP-binding protein